MPSLKKRREKATFKITGPVVLSVTSKTGVIHVFDFTNKEETLCHQMGGISPDAPHLGKVIFLTGEERSLHLCKHCRKSLEKSVGVKYGWVQSYLSSYGIWKITAVESDSHRRDIFEQTYDVIGVGQISRAEVKNEQNMEKQ
jgi:hypothetical protein